MFISAPTLDDLLQKSFRRVLNRGSRITSGRGASREVLGAILELKNPRARLSRTENRGKVFSGLGEFLWYMSRSNDLDFVSHYIEKYKKETEDGKTIYGGYGPRLFANRGQNQIENVLSILQAKGDSRRAVIQLFNAEDIAKKHLEIPCTCVLQFMRRNDQLHMVTFMRSNDVFLGLPHDVFSFTMLQEVIASTLGIGLGTYRHAVGSLHLYDDFADKARAYLAEGWQSTESDRAMPAMPHQDPWSNIRSVLNAEAKIRGGENFALSNINIDPYWKDLIRLLKILQAGKSDSPAELKKISQLKRGMSSRVYDIYIDTYFKRRRTAASNTPNPPQLPLVGMEEKLRNLSSTNDLIK